MTSSAVASPLEVPADSDPPTLRSCPPTPYTDEDTLARHAAVQKFNIRAVRALFYGSRCTQEHYVAVPVHRGYEDAPRDIDLHIELYVFRGNEPRNRTVDLRNGTIFLKCFPAYALTDLPYQYTFFIGRENTTAQTWRIQNLVLMAMNGTS
ncbi:hypothetical protein BKA70DRAFT_1451907 [Coprinopsis sp. MPI-PUGE-AT-0042]|nr:hypothetical protein BKA70DRAFT_1451907 [Coprinopsis sp. MPI-PUGE-AT-0042]